MFDDHEIEYREELDAEDFARAEDLVRDGMEFERALGYLRSWAQQMHWDSHVESLAARDFERKAY